LPPIGYVFIRGALDVGVAPANMNHVVLTKQPTVIEISAIGPLAFNYVNPADDPSKK
jgi:hypothetical protein